MLDHESHGEVLVPPSSLSIDDLPLYFIKKMSYQTELSFNSLCQIYMSTCISIHLTLIFFFYRKDVILCI